MYIDGDTHYWPVRFLERREASRARVHRVSKRAPATMIRYGEKFPGDAATYYRDGKNIHPFSKRRAGISTCTTRSWSGKASTTRSSSPTTGRLSMKSIMTSASRWRAPTTNTVAEDIAGKDRFIGIAWVYLPDVDEAIRELRRAVKGPRFQRRQAYGRPRELRSRRRSAVAVLRGSLQARRADPGASGHARVRSAGLPPLARRQRALRRLQNARHCVGVSAHLHGQRGASDHERRTRPLPDVAHRGVRRRRRLGAVADDERSIITPRRIAGTRRRSTISSASATGSRKSRALTSIRSMSRRLHGRTICRTSSRCGRTTTSSSAATSTTATPISTWPNTVCADQGDDRDFRSGQGKILGGNAMRLFGMRGRS